MRTQLPVYLEKVVYNLRGGFLVRPLVIALTLGLVGTGLSQFEARNPSLTNGLPPILFPSNFDHEVGQTILATIAGSVMTVVSIVFAILLMSLTLASMQFSPRIIVSFTKDRVTQWTLGMFLGTFSYCISALPAARSYPAPFSPIVTVTGAMFLALVSVAWLLFFIHHISQSISVNYIVDRIATETVAMIDEMQPRPRRGRVRLSSVEEASPFPGTSLISPDSGYVRYIDAPLLLRIAKQHHLCIAVTRRVGHFIPERVPFLVVADEEKLTPEIEAELTGAFDIGPTRTLQQDVEFGILQIVDIALRAISPAVNDPSTAICCIDHLSRILIHFASRDNLESQFYDPPGKLRLSIPTLGLDRLVHSAFDQIRAYSKTDLAVSLRMLRALTDVSLSVDDNQECRLMLSAMGKRIESGCEASLEEEDLPELRRRLATLIGLESSA